MIPSIYFVFAGLLLGFLLGIPAGHASLRNALQEEGYIVTHNLKAKRGEGRYRVIDVRDLLKRSL